MCQRFIVPLVDSSLCTMLTYVIVGLSVMLLLLMFCFSDFLMMVTLGDYYYHHYYLPTSILQSAAAGGVLVSGCIVPNVLLASPLLCKKLLSSCYFSLQDRHSVILNV